MDEPRQRAVKVASKSKLVFAVEAIVASQAQARAQKQKHWQGRAFLPTLHAVGDGRIVDEVAEEEAQGASLLVMEVADGTLEDHGRLAGDALLMVAWALSSTLALLNSVGFIHGDLKPSNVLWRRGCTFKRDSVVEGLNGWPMLTDFGSAQCFHSMSANREPLENDTQIETYGFTPAFAGPEVRQCGGKRQTMRSDMYSFAKTVEKIGRGSLPEVLEEICKQCLQENPMERPENFLAIASALEESCPTCFLWGAQLWHQQQSQFSSAALAHQHRMAVEMQGLEVLRSQRIDRLGHLIEGRKTKQAIAPCILLANQLVSMGSPAEACRQYREALVLNPCWAVHPIVLRNLGNAEGRLGNAAREKDLLERALKIFEGFYGQNHPEVAITLTRLGTAEGLGNAARRKELLELALNITEGFYGQDHPEVASTLTILGNAEGSLGNAARQKELLERALEIFEGFYCQDHPDVAVALTSLGNAEGDLGNAARQKDLLERALEIQEGFYGQDHPLVAKTLTNLGNAERSLGNATRQKDHLERALKIMEGFHGRDHCWVAIILTNLGNAEGSLGNAARQKDLLEHALEIQEGFYDQDHPDVAVTLTSLGNAEGNLGNAARQKDLLERGLRIEEGFYGRDHPKVAVTLADLGNAEGDLGNAARMKELLERALKIKEGFYGLDHPELAITLSNLGKAEGDLGNATRMKELLERALEIHEGFYGQDHPEAAIILTNLGIAECQLGRVEAGKKILEKAAELLSSHGGRSHPNTIKVRQMLSKIEMLEALAHS